MANYNIDGKINPLIQKNIMALKERMNDSVNNSMNATKRNLMRSQAAMNLKKQEFDEKEIKEKLEVLHKERIVSRNKMEKIARETNTGEVELSGVKENHNDEEAGKKSFNAKRLNKIKKLGMLGIELEEINLGIEKRYEEMLQSMRSKLSSIRTHFSNLLDDVQKDFTEKIMNEKRQNIGNIKDLEEDLNKAIS